MRVRCSRMEILRVLEVYLNQVRELIQMFHLADLILVKENDVEIDIRWQCIDCSQISRREIETSEVLMLETFIEREHQGLTDGSTGQRPILTLAWRHRLAYHLHDG